MRVVLDSNIYVSAALSVEGHSRSILKLAEKKLFEVPIRLHFRRGQTHSDAKLAWSPAKAALWMDYVGSITYRVQPQQHVYDSPDPGDNHILECALEAQAQVIVTGDRDLLGLHPSRGIEILTPRQFLESVI